MSGFWKRPVAAGWYVGVGITLLLVGLPAQLVSNDFMRWTFVPLGLLCLLGAAYEWWIRPPVADAMRPVALPTPNVLLESSQGLFIRRAAYDSLEPVDLIVYNDSTDATAMDVEIRDLSSGNYRAGYWTGDAATPAGPVLVNTTLRFEPVPHLDGRRRASVQPINSSFSVQEKMLRGIKGGAPGLWWFIDACRRRREEEETDQLPTNERETVAARLRNKPIEIPIVVTYADAERARRWQRLETLHYDPTTLNAHIRHDERRELSASATAVAGPKAVVNVLGDADHAEVRVRNDGPIADFWATLSIEGQVRAFWDVSDLLCRWTHTASVRTRIARGQECRIMLAENVRVHEIGPTFGASTWHIYAWSGDKLVTIESMWTSTPLSKPPAVAPDIVLEGSIVADPDLQNGIQRFRVVLRAFEAVAAEQK